MINTTGSYPTETSHSENLKTESGSTTGGNKELADDSPTVESVKQDPLAPEFKTSNLKKDDQQPGIVSSAQAALPDQLQKAKVELTNEFREALQPSNKHYALDPTGDKKLFVEVSAHPAPDQAIARINSQVSDIIIFPAPFESPFTGDYDYALNEERVLSEGLSSSEGEDKTKVTWVKGEFHKIDPISLFFYENYSNDLNDQATALQQKLELRAGVILTVDEIVNISKEDLSEKLSEKGTKSKGKQKTFLGDHKLLQRKKEALEKSKTVVENQFQRHGETFNPQEHTYAAAREAYYSAVDSILTNSDNNKDVILHIHLRGNETGTMLEPDQLDELKEKHSNLKVLLKVHEYKMNRSDDRKEDWQRPVHAYTQKSDQIMFLNHQDKSQLMRNMEDGKPGYRNELLSAEKADSSKTADYVSADPESHKQQVEGATVFRVPGLMSTKPTELKLDDYEKRSGIIWFGTIRKGKGMESMLKMAVHVNNTKDTTPAADGDSKANKETLRIMGKLSDSSFLADEIVSKLFNADVSNNDKKSAVNAITEQLDSVTEQEGTVKISLSEILNHCNLSNECCLDPEKVEIEFVFNAEQKDVSENLNQSLFYYQSDDHKGMAANGSGSINALSHGLVPVMNYGGRKGTFVPKNPSPPFLHNGKNNQGISTDLTMKDKVDGSERTEKREKDSEFSSLDPESAAQRIMEFQNLPEDARNEFLQEIIDYQHDHLTDNAYIGKMLTVLTDTIDGGNATPS